MSAAEEALRAAMGRLLAGEARLTDGALTKKNLYLEAQVSRATMNRAAQVIRDWDAAVGARLGEDPEAKRPVTEASKLRRELRQAKKTIRGLRATVDGAASLIALLTEENRYLRQQLNSSPDAKLADLEEYRARE